MQFIMKSLQLIGLGVMIFGFVAFAFEAPVMAPLWHQLALWACSLVAIFGGYRLYRVAGGQWSARSMFIQPD